MKISDSYLNEEYIKSNILPSYNLKNCEVLIVKSKNSDKPRIVYKIVSQENIYCLKKVYYSKEDLLYMYSATEWLYRNNINVPKLLPTATNKRFVCKNNMLFILTPWIDGDKCNFDNINHVNSSIINLASIHKVSENFHPISGSTFKIGFDNFYISIKKHYEDLLLSSNNANNYRDKFSKHFLSCFDENLRLAKISLYFSSKINFDNLSRSLCHGDYVNKNIIFTNLGNIWTIDFDKCKNDFCAKDLSYFMRRILKRDNTKWDLPLAESIIKNYISIKELNLSDIYYIISYLSFPQKYWKISRDYYKNVSKCNKNSFKTLLDDAIHKTEEQYEFILNFIDSLQIIFSTQLI